VRRAAALLLLGVRRPLPSIDICCRRGAQQQTRRSGVRRVNDETDSQTDRQTDGRTPDSFIDPAPHTTRQQCQQSEPHTP